MPTKMSNNPAFEPAKEAVSESTSQTVPKGLEAEAAATTRLGVVAHPPESALLALIDRQSQWFERMMEKMSDSFEPAVALQTAQLKVVFADATSAGVEQQAANLSDFRGKISGIVRGYDRTERTESMHYPPPPPRSRVEQVSDATTHFGFHPPESARRSIGADKSDLKVASQLVQLLGRFDSTLTKDGRTSRTRVQQWLKQFEIGLLTHYPDYKGVEELPFTRVYPILHQLLDANAQLFIDSLDEEATTWGAVRKRMCEKYGLSKYQVKQLVMHTRQMHNERPSAFFFDRIDGLAAQAYLTPDWLQNVVQRNLRPKMQDLIAAAEAGDQGANSSKVVFDHQRFRHYLTAWERQKSQDDWVPRHDGGAHGTEEVRQYDGPWSSDGQRHKDRPRDPWQLRWESQDRDNQDQRELRDQREHRNREHSEHKEWSRPPPPPRSGKPKTAEPGPVSAIQEREKEFELCNFVGSVPAAPAPSKATSPNVESCNQLRQALLQVGVDAASLESSSTMINTIQQAMEAGVEYVAE